MQKPTNQEALQALIHAIAGAGEGYIVISHTMSPQLAGLRSKSLAADDPQAVEAYLGQLPKESQVLISLARQQEALPESRRGKTETVRALSIIGMDIDIASPAKPDKQLPGSVEEAQTLLDNYKLPPSLTVVSGRGLHAYWFLDAEVQINHADDLRRAKQLVEGFYADFAEYAKPFSFDHTHDLSRALRVPGFLNRKDEDDVRPVYALTLDPSRRYSPLSIPTAPRSRTTSARGATRDRASDENRQVDLSRVIAGCAWMRRVHQHPAQSGYEEWFAYGSIASLSHGGRETFHKWSSGHPDYDPDEADAKFDQIDPDKAARTCEMLSATVHGRKACARCQLRGGIASPVELGLPGPKSVVVNQGDLPAKTSQAWAATFINNHPPRLFAIDKAIVRVDSDASQWEVLDQKTAKHEFARQGRWCRVNRTGDLVPSDPAPAVIDDMLATSKPPLPRLNKVSKVPIVTREGRLVLEEGYDAGSGVFRTYDPSLIGLKVSSEVGAEEAQAAARFILDEVLADFPFDSAQSRAHALALMLHDFARDLISGASPLFLIDKPVHGSGASLLAAVCCYPVLGAEISSNVLPSSEDERRKQITSHLYSGGGPYLLDNVSGQIDSNVISSAVTSRQISDRILGVSKQVKLLNLGPWIATGNNPSFSGQMTRRILEIRLVPQTDTPHLRTGFKHDPLLPWVADNRKQIVEACLTIVMGWVQAGMPLWAGKPLGSFESFSRVMGGILEYAGVGGFMTNMTFQLTGVDFETEQIRELVAALWDHQGDRAFEVKHVISLAEDRELDVAAHWADHNTRAQSTKAGQFLQTLKDRWFSVEDSGTRKPVCFTKTGKRSTFRLMVAPDA